MAFARDISRRATKLPGQTLGPVQKFGIGVEASSREMGQHGRAKPGTAGLGNRRPVHLAPADLKALRAANIPLDRPGDVNLPHLVG